jgi:hypothetical protein
MRPTVEELEPRAPPSTLFGLKASNRHHGHHHRHAKLHHRPHVAEAVTASLDADGNLTINGTRGNDQVDVVTGDDGGFQVLSRGAAVASFADDWFGLQWQGRGGRDVFNIE